MTASHACSALNGSWWIDPSRPVLPPYFYPYPCSDQADPTQPNPTQLNSTQPQVSPPRRSCRHARDVCVKMRTRGAGLLVVQRWREGGLGGNRQSEASNSRWFPTHTHTIWHEAKIFAFFFFGTICQLYIRAKCWFHEYFFCIIPSKENLSSQHSD